MQSVDTVSLNAARAALKLHTTSERCICIARLTLVGSRMHEPAIPVHGALEA